MNNFSTLLRSNKFFKSLVGCFIFLISGCIAVSNYLELNVDYRDHNGSVDLNFTKRDFNISVGGK